MQYWEQLELPLPTTLKDVSGELFLIMEERAEQLLLELPSREVEQIELSF